MNRKRRNLIYIQFKNAVCEKAGVSVAVNRDLTFRGVIGKTKDGKDIYQNRNEIYFLDLTKTSPIPFYSHKIKKVVNVTYKDLIYKGEQ